MVTVNPFFANETHGDDGFFQSRFFPEEIRQSLARDDSIAGRAIALILIAIISFGLLSMIASLWFAL